MNEAQQMHDELVNALLPIIPRTTRIGSKSDYNSFQRTLKGICASFSSKCINHRHQEYRNDWREIGPFDIIHWVSQPIAH